jgi:hypothetical protein
MALMMVLRCCPERSIEQDGQQSVTPARGLKLLQQEIHDFGTQPGAGDVAAANVQHPPPLQFGKESRDGFADR